jgi:hypothetical protein
MTNGKNLTGPSKEVTSWLSKRLVLKETNFSNLLIIIFEKKPLKNKNNKKINTARKTSEKFIPPTPLDQTSENKFVKLLIIFMPLDIELYS